MHLAFPRLTARSDCLFNLVQGAFSGIASVVIKTPVEAVKVVAQNSHISAGGAIRKLMAEQGFMGLYRGTGTVAIVRADGRVCVFFVQSGSSWLSRGSWASTAVRALLPLCARMGVCVFFSGGVRGAGFKAWIMDRCAGLGGGQTSEMWGLSLLMLRGSPLGGVEASVTGEHGRARVPHRELRCELACAACLY